MNRRLMDSVSYTIIGANYSERGRGMRRRTLHFPGQGQLCSLGPSARFCFGYGYLRGSSAREGREY